MKKWDTTHGTVKIIRGIQITNEMQIARGIQITKEITETEIWDIQTSKEGSEEETSEEEIEIYEATQHQRSKKEPTMYKRLKNKEPEIIFDSQRNIESWANK